MASLSIYNFSAKEFLEEQRGILVEEIVLIELDGENIIIHALLKNRWDNTPSKAAITHEDFQKIHNKAYLTEV